MCIWASDHDLFRASLTLMVTLMALFMLPLYSQPCLVIPPFWEPSEAVSWGRMKTVRADPLRAVSHHHEDFQHLHLAGSDFYVISWLIKGDAFSS